MSQGTLAPSSAAPCINNSRRKLALHVPDAREQEEHDGQVTLGGCVQQRLVALVVGHGAAGPVHQQEFDAVAPTMPAGEDEWGLAFAILLVSRWGRKRPMMR